MGLYNRLNTTQLSARMVQLKQPSIWKIQLKYDKDENINITIDKIENEIIHLIEIFYVKLSYKS